jgi:hypothetical protein
MNTKIEQIKELLLSLDANMPLVVEDRPDGTVWLIGPYPSFVIMAGVVGAPDGYIVSVNADAPQVIFYLRKVFEKFPDLEHYGPYCEDEENSTIVGGPEAYEMKDNITLKAAAAIFKRRKEEKGEPINQLIVPEQKITLDTKL